MGFFGRFRRGELKRGRIEAFPGGAFAIIAYSCVATASYRVDAWTEPFILPQAERES